MVKKGWAGRHGLARLIASCSVASLALVPISGRAVAGAAPSENVYVGNDNGGPVLGYRAVSSGLASPIREADAPANNRNIIWDPQNVAFDRSGNLYVQSFASEADTFVYAPHPDQGDKPTRIFSLYFPDTQGIGVDNSGFEYVLSGDTCCFVAVGPPGASGTFSNSYHVNPLRTVGVGFVFPPWTQTLAIADGRNYLVVLPGTPNNAIVTYPGGRHGSANPLRTISGANTTLGSCPPSSCDQNAITVSPATGSLYVAVSSGQTLTHICVFAENAEGNVKPLRVIEGPATGLTGKVITGIAVSQVTGNIFVMVKSAQFSAPGRIEVFGSQAHGNVAPIRTFTDRVSRFRDALGIAISNG